VTGRAKSLPHALSALAMMMYVRVEPCTMWGRSFRLTAVEMLISNLNQSENESTLNSVMHAFYAGAP